MRRPKEWDIFLIDPVAKWRWKARPLIRVRGTKREAQRMAHEFLWTNPMSDGVMFKRAEYPDAREPDAFEPYQTFMWQILE